MLCPNCKTENDDAANFCTNCRANLKETLANKPEETAEPVAAPATPVAPEAPATPAAPVKPAASTENPNFFACMLGVCLKPMTTFKENLAKFANVKNASIIAVIVVVMMTLFATIQTTIKTVRYDSCSSGSFSFTSKKKEKCEVKWEWDNLEDAELPKFIGQTLLMNVLTILFISGAYFGMSKAFKSQTADFFRMLTVVALGFIPTTILGFLAPVIGGINLTIGGTIGILGALYSLFIIMIGLNNESGLEGDKKVYLNIAAAVCIAIGYYIVLRFEFGEAGGLMFKGILQSGAGSVDLSGLTGGSSSSSFDFDDLLNF